MGAKIKPNFESLKKKRDVNSLIELLSYRQEKGFQRIPAQAADALGEIGDLKAIEPLIEAVNGEIKNAAWALAKIGDPRAIPPLEKALCGKNMFKEEIARALSALGWEPNSKKAEVEYWMAKGEFRKAADVGILAIRPLVRFLKLPSISKFEGQDRAALSALASIDYPSVIRHILEFTPDDDSIHISKIQHLARVGDESVIPYLKRISTSKFEMRYVREEAKKALQKVEDRLDTSRQ